MSSVEINWYNDKEYSSIILLYDKYTTFSEHKIMYIAREIGFCK